MGPIRVRSRLVPRGSPVIVGPRVPVVTVELVARALRGDLAIRVVRGLMDHRAFRAFRALVGLELRATPELLVLESVEAQGIVVSVGQEPAAIPGLELQDIPVVVFPVRAGIAVQARAEPQGSQA